MKRLVCLTHRSCNWQRFQCVNPLTPGRNYTSVSDHLTAHVSPPIRFFLDWCRRAPHLSRDFDRHRVITTHGNDWLRHQRTAFWSRISLKGEKTSVPDKCVTLRIHLSESCGTGPMKDSRGRGDVDTVPAQVLGGVQYELRASAMNISGC